MRIALLAFVLASAIRADIITDVRQAIAANQFERGDAAIKSYRAQRGVTPEMIEALSWMARGALGAGQLDKAEAYARETRGLLAQRLKTHSVDSDPHLALALGAAIEVQGQVLSARGDRSGAVAFLRKELAAYAVSSIRTRIQKNIKLLSLQGKPAPLLHVEQFLGPKPSALTALRWKPVLLFFWAHWCGDCKAEEPLLAEIRREYAAKGLAVIAPTQRYGYAARGEDATPEQELKYIDAVWRQFYPDLRDVPVPISEANFKAYGASTTPTLVFIDRSGVVRLYHPGAMSLEELRAAVSSL